MSPESIIQDRMNTIHILMKRYDFDSEEIREEELGHARKVAQKKIELLPFSGLVDTVPASVLKDREESLDIIFNATEYPEQQDTTFGFDIILRWIDFYSRSNLNRPTCSISPIATGATNGSSTPSSK